MQGRIMWVLCSGIFESWLESVQDLLLGFAMPGQKIHAEGRHDGVISGG